jgi:hypothetical protein
MRAKTEYAMADVNGKKVPQKVGMAPIQRDGVEYEFTVSGEMDLEHNLIISKTRCSELADAVIKFPGAQLARTLRDWLETGEPVVAMSATITDISPVSDNEMQQELEASLLVQRIKKIKNIFELANWKKKHTGELSAIKASRPDLYEKIVSAGKEKAGEFNTTTSEEA